VRLLIVEDDMEASATMCRGLTEAGHSCETAPDGAAGLRQAQKGEFDVLVVDRMMPRMDGVTMVEELRRDGTTRRCCSCPRWARSRIGWPG
jgi:two-component system OmpR family response regulator